MIKTFQQLKTAAVGLNFKDGATPKQTAHECRTIKCVPGAYQTRPWFPAVVASELVQYSEVFTRR